MATISKKMKDEAEKIYNNCKVIRFSHVKNKKTFWECQCHCGQKFIARIDSLKYGSIISCGCSGKNTWRQNPFCKPDLVGEISLRRFNKWKRKAKERNILFNISRKYLWSLSRPTECMFTGEKLSYQHKKWVASIDRIDSNEGYIEDNIRWISGWVNKARGKLNDYVFIKYTWLIHHWSTYKIIPTSQNNQFSKFRQTNMCALKHNAKSRNKTLNINLDDINKLFFKQKRRCNLTGLPLFVSKTTEKTKTTASIDRIDSKFGYTLDNVQIVHKIINMMKRDTQQDEFIRLCDEVVKRRLFDGCDSWSR